MTGQLPNDIPNSLCLDSVTNAKGKAKKTNLKGVHSPSDPGRSSEYYTAISVVTTLQVVDLRLGPRLQGLVCRAKGDSLLVGFSI